MSYPFEVNNTHAHESQKKMGKRDQFSFWGFKISKLFIALVEHRLAVISVLRQVSRANFGRV